MRQDHFRQGFRVPLRNEPPATSPTFTIINEYANASVRILHADLYRLRTPDELRDIGIEDEIANSDVSFIEWPGNAWSFPIPWTARLYFSMGDGENEKKDRNEIAGKEKAMDDIKLGVIGGSGIYELKNVTVEKEIAVKTPFGDPSDKIVVARVGGRQVAFLPVTVKATASCWVSCP